MAVLAELYKQFFDAASIGDLVLIKQCVEKGAKIRAKDDSSWTALHYVARHNGRLECLKYFVEMGINIHAKTETGSTALHLAAEGGHLECMKYLVRLGADVNSKTSLRRMSPLHAASGNGRLNCVQYLIEQGAIIDAKDNDGKTPISWAIECVRPEIAEFLQMIIDAITENKRLDSRIKVDETVDHGFGF